MLKSIQTIEKCLLVQTGFQELKGINDGVQILVGLLSQKLNLVIYYFLNSKQKNN